LDIKVPLGRSEEKSVNKWQQSLENSSTWRWYYNISKLVGKEWKIQIEISNDLIKIRTHRIKFNTCNNKEA